MPRIVVSDVALTEFWPKTENWYESHNIELSGAIVFILTAVNNDLSGAKKFYIF